MDRTVRISAMGTALVLAAGVVVSIVTSTLVVSRSMEQRTRAMARARQDITVKGSSRQRVLSDTAVWDIAVSGEAPTLEGAYGIIEESASRIRGFLTQKGFAPGDVALSAIDTDTHYRRDGKGEPTREVSGYTLRRTFTVTSADCRKVDAAAAEVTALIKDGVKVASAQPRFYFSKLPDLKVQILGDAAKDARGRADEIVKNAGGTVGPVRDAQMGVMQITRPNSTETSGYGMYDTSTIEKDVTAVVTVTFGVEN